MLVFDKFWWLKLLSLWDQLLNQTEFDTEIVIKTSKSIFDYQYHEWSNINLFQMYYSKHPLILWNIFLWKITRNSITHWYPPPPRIREIQLDPSPMLLPAARRTTPRRRLPPTKDQGSGQLLSKLLLPYILLPWKTKKQKVYTISQAWKQGKARVVYICSSLSQLTSGSRELSQAEKKIT